MERATARVHEWVTVVTVRLGIVVDRQIHPSDLARLVERVADNDLVTPAVESCRALHAALVAEGVLARRKATSARSWTARVAVGDLLGFHRAYLFTPDQVSVTGTALLRPLVNLPGTDHLPDTSPDPGCFSFVGNGSSIYVGRDWRESPTDVIDYYEYHYLRLMLLDDSLGALVRSVHDEDVDEDVRVRAERDLGELRGRATLFLMAHEEHLSSLAPDELAYWQQMEAGWRTQEMAVSLNEKILRLDETISELIADTTREQARRTRLIVTALTCLTIMTLVVETVAFVEAGPIWARSLWVAGGFLLATAIFAVIQLQGGQPGE